MGIVADASTQVPHIRLILFCDHDLREADPAVRQRNGID
jgi:hypothetical protein